MSFFPNAQHAPIHIQDAALTAVGGDQNNHPGGSMTVAGPNHIAGNQNIYQGLPVKGKGLLLERASPAALPNSSARIDQPRCMAETRVELGKELDDWEKSEIDSATMMWVHGGVGTGKTALLLTFADLCRRYRRLVGAFFASNRFANCSDGDRIVATLAIQLIQAFPSTKRYINRAIRADPLLFSRGREEQMKVLIVEPIKQVATMVRFLNAVTFGLKSYPTLIVIDGLDEVNGNDVQCDIIRIIGAAMKDVRLPLRFLVASRPEPHICLAVSKLQSQFPDNYVSVINMNQDALVHRDIQHYFTIKFSEIRAMHPYLPANWPSSDVVAHLLDRASGQFIFATTIISYFSSPDDRPDDRLKVILKLLETPVGDTPYATLDQLYTHIVHSVPVKHRAEVMRILGQLIIIRDLTEQQDIIGVLSKSSRIEQILGLRDGDVKRLLRTLHSVIDVGDDLKLLHASFPDFLLDSSRSTDFFIDVEESRVMLGLAYIPMICNLSFATLVRFEQAKRFEQNLSVVVSAVKHCTEAGLSKQLSEGWRNADIISRYELLVHSAPWKRHSATLALKKINKLLTENGCPSLYESEIDVRLKAFWGTYTWEVVPNTERATRTGLKIYLYDTGSHFPQSLEFLARMSDHGVLGLYAHNHDVRHVEFKGPNKDDPMICFNICKSTLAGDEALEDSDVGFRFYDENHQKSGRYNVKLPLVYRTGEEGRARAWEMLAYACHQCEWLR